MILLGPAGSPEKSTLDGISKIKELRLQSMEIQFTHGVKMGLDLAEQIGDEAKRNDVNLSIHAPYYINLASLEKEKTQASIGRILDSCERGNLLGKNNKVPIVFHPGFYMKRDAGEVYGIIKEGMLKLRDTIRSNGWRRVTLAPETTGKPTQFGDIDELLRLSKETDSGICVDFAHIYARNNGNIDYDEVFSKLRGINNLHSHFSGIEFTQKGERNHIVLTEEFFFPLAKHLIDEFSSGQRTVNVISESPVTWKDSLLMRKILEDMGYKF